MSSWNSQVDSEKIKGTNSNSISEVLPHFADMLAYFQVYPDRFIDYIKSPDSKFELYPFQRIFLRIMARYKKVY